MSKIKRITINEKVKKMPVNKEKEELKKSRNEVKEKLNTFIDRIYDRDDLEKLKGLLDRVDKLEDLRKEKLLKKLFEPFGREIKEQENSQNYETCRLEGHDWGKWDEIIHCTGQYYDRDYGAYRKTYKSTWIRKCKKCACEEKRNDMPQEVKEELYRKRNERLIREKKDEIEKAKQLVKSKTEELNKLQENKPDTE